jgi:hypothetical protein
MTSMTIRDRRLKRFVLDRETLLRILNWRPGGTLYSVHVRDIPDDAELVGIDYDWSYQSFTCVARHPSFEEVPEGSVIPVTFDVTVWAHELPDVPAVGHDAPTAIEG